MKPIWSLNFNLGLLSRYRSQLMGAATIMILACHIKLHGVAFPHSIEYFFLLGDLGVDIFLLLSGMGLWFSYTSFLAKQQGSDSSKITNIARWESKRFKRILIPYTLLAIPYLVFRCAIDNLPISFLFLEYSTINYWLQGTSAWFLALLFLLYLLFPIINYIIGLGSNRFIMGGGNKYFGICDCSHFIFG